MYAVFYNTAAGPGYVDLEDLINGSELSPIPMGCISTSNHMGNSISCDESILFADATAFHSISVETGSNTRLFVFSEAGIGNSVYPLVLPIKTADGSIYIRDDSFNISRLEPRLVPKKETLVYMSNNLGSGINMIMNKFNKTNDKYKIEHVVFDASNGEKLIAEILAGKAPDILDVSFINKIISNKQIFADLMPHIESDEKVKADDLYMNILNGFKSDDQLYAFPSSFGISAIAVPYTGNFLIKNPGFEEFEEILEKAGAAKEGKRIEPKAFFELALPVIEKDILIGEQGTRRIDKEALIKWLELSEKIPKYRVSRLEIYNLSSFSSDRKFLGEFTIVGFPGKNVSGAYAKTRFLPFLSIMKNTKSEEAAWEFVREYLVSECDPLSFSLNRKIAEKNTDEYLRLAKVHKENVTEEDAENLKELLRSINIAENPDTSLRNIILEEAEAYFSGQRNIEKTVELIENRANILISEKGL